VTPNDYTSVFVPVGIDLDRVKTIEFDAPDPAVMEERIDFMPWTKPDFCKWLVGQLRAHFYEYGRYPATLRVLRCCVERVTRVIAEVQIKIDPPCEQGDKLIAAWAALKVEALP